MPLPGPCADLIDQPQTEGELKATGRRCCAANRTATRTASAGLPSSWAWNQPCVRLVGQGCPHRDMQALSTGIRPVPFSCSQPLAACETAWVDAVVERAADGRRLGGDPPECDAWSTVRRCGVGPTDRPLAGPRTDAAPRRPTEAADSLTFPARNDTCHIHLPPGFENSVVIEPSSQVGAPESLTIRDDWTLGN